VDNRSSNSPLSKTSRTLLRAAGISCLCLFFLCSLAVGAYPTSDVRDSAVNQPRVNLPFAIADFDGDLRPDLVAVCTGTGNGLRTDYWIQLQLSAAGRQTILVVAPTGGLQIAARDVNGDHAPDLVVTTTWLNQPVAVFLNDGHGGFSRVDPGAFPEAFSESTAFWSSATNEMSKGDCVPSDSRQDIGSKVEVVRHVRSQSRFVARSDLRSDTDRFLISRLGRAPPLEISRS
jgi:hypothetical protein